jgi:hypothetical protein
MPLPPPVMSATLPVKSMVSLLDAWPGLYRHPVVGARRLFVRLVPAAIRWTASRQCGNR